MVTSPDPEDIKDKEFPCQVIRAHYTLFKLCRYSDNNIAIDDLIQPSFDEYNELDWIPHSDIAGIKPSQIDNVHYVVCQPNCEMITLVLLRNDEICTSTFVSSPGYIHSQHTSTCCAYSKNIDKFRRHSIWLKTRNELIEGFTKYEDNYYMVAGKCFYHCYSRYGFCSACGILLCVVLLWHYFNHFI